MRIEYDLKFRDYLLFNGLHQLLSPAVQFFYLFCVLAVFVTEPEGTPLAVRVLAAILFYIAVWTIQLLFNVVYLYSSKNRTILTQHTITVQDEWLLDETTFSKSQHYWAGIHKVVRRPGFVAVYMNAHAAHIIPSRAFPSDEHRSRFVSEIKIKLATA